MRLDVTDVDQWAVHWIPLRRSARVHHFALWKKLGKELKMAQKPRFLAERVFCTFMSKAI